MATFAYGCSEGYGNKQPYHLGDENLLYGPLQTCSMDQGNGQILQQQQSGQPEDAGRILSFYTLSFEGGQGACGSQSFLQEQLVEPENTIESLLQGVWISQGQGSQPLRDQYLSQSQTKLIGDPLSKRISEEEEEARRLRKREVDRAYRQREKLKKRTLEDENDQLKQALGAAKERWMQEIEEKEQLKSNLEALEAEVLRLKHEIQNEQIWMDKLQDEVKRLNAELESEKGKNVLLNETVEDLSMEMAGFQNQCAELTQQNVRRITSTREQDMVREEYANERLKFLSREWRRIKCLLRTNFKKLRARGLKKFLSSTKKGK